MDYKLFNNEVDRKKNYLPYDGIVHYYGSVFDEVQAEEHFKQLRREVLWQNDEHLMFGKRIITSRKMAWYGDQAYEYKYSNITRTASVWTPELLSLKSLVEEITGESFNSCLLNLYHNGSEGMSWHSDDEKELVPDAAIASISLGAERRFSFKHKKSKEKVDLFLENGSLLVMKGATQSHWLHQLPKSQKISEERINLTFRSIISSSDRL